MICQPEKCMAIIAAYPDLQASPGLVAWLHASGVRHIEVHRHGEGCMDCGYNYGVEVALGSDFDQFVFADKDIWPSNHSDAFWTPDADVVSCEYPTPQLHSWDAPEAFHTGLWRTHRRVLERVGMRPFQWHLSETGTTVTECLCEGFARKAKAAGFTIAHSGIANHTPRTPTILPVRAILTPPPEAPHA